MKKRPKKHRHRTRSCTEDETNIKLNTLFKDFFNILEDSPQPEEGFDTGSQEYRLAMLWLNKLVAMPCLTLLDGEIRNSYMSQLSACISQRRLCGIFEQMPPATLERMEFREIAQQTVQRTTSCQNAGAMHDTMQSQSQSNERLEELTTPRPHTTSLQPFDMESESMGEAQQHMQQTMDEPLEHPYESTTSLEPYEMTSDSCNQSLGGSQRPQEDTLDEGIQYFDPRLASPSSNDSSCNMESRTLKHFMDRAQHHLEQTLEEPQHLFDPREYPPTTLLEPTEIRRDAFSQSLGVDQQPIEDTTDENITYFDADLSSRSPHKGSSNMESRTLKHFMDRAQHHLEQGTSLPRTSSQLEPSGMRCHIMDQSMRGYGDQLEEDAMAEGIKIPDSPLSLLSSHEGPANMENRDFNQSMVGDQQPMEDAMDGSGEASSSVQCIAFKQSFEEFLHHMQRTMDEIGKHLDQSDVYPMSTTSMEPCETTRRSINQSIDGDQQPTEVIPFLNPSSLDVDPCHMEYQVFDQPAGGEECLWEDNMNEGNEIFESALSSSLSDEDTCKVEYRDFNQWNSMEPSEMRRDSFSQSLGGDQQPMEDAMDGSGDVSSRVEYRAFNQFLDESLHHMQRTMDEIGKHLDQSDAYPMSTTSMEPCEMTRRSINQSIDGDQQPTEVIPFLNPSSLEVGPCHMEYQVFDQPADGEECLWEDNMNEGNEIFESALSSSLSDEDTCTVEYREFNQSMGGDQHPMDTMGKRGESITFFDPKLSPPSPLEEELSDTELPSFRQYISSGVHLPDTTMGGGLPQFKKTTKDASQFHDSVHPAGIEKPMVSSQNVMQETLLGIQKIFKSANGATKPSLGSHPVGQSGMGKFSFNQSVGGPQQLMQRMLGGAELGDEKTKRAPQKMQNSPLESPADMDVYPWVSMRRGISKSMSCPQIVMLSTLEEPSKCHDNTKLEAQQLEKGSRPGTGPGTGTGPGPGKMEQPSLPVERPKLLRHKTMDIAQQGDKNNKADAPTFECPGPSGMGSYLWDSMGRAIGKSISGLQMLMQNATDESLNGHGKIGSGFQKLNAVINGDFVTSDMVGRRHFGCLSCFDASPKCNRQAPDARSTCCDGSHYPIPYPIAHEEASAGPAVTFSKERRTHKPDDEQRKDLLHILETVQGELRGAATVGHDDCLEKEMLRYRDWLTKTKERKLKKITRGGNAIAVRRYLLQSMEKDLLDLLK